MRVSRSPLSLAAAACLALTAPPAVESATRTANFIVRVNVVSDCTISATALDFGTLTLTPAGVLAADMTSSSQILVTCTPLAPYEIALNAGTGSGSTIAARNMDNGAGATVPYQLYTANDFATIWGDGANTTSTVGETGTGSQQTFTVHGRINPPLPSQPPVGSYSSIVTATITY